MGNADTDRLLAGDGDSDNASRQRPAVGELGSRFSAGGSPRERDAPTCDFVGPVDDLGLVARLGVDEEQEPDMTSLAIEIDQRLGGGGAPGGARVGGSASADSDRTEASNATAEQPLSMAPPSAMTPVPVIPATRASPAAACACIAVS